MLDISSIKSQDVIVSGEVRGESGGGKEGGREGEGGSKGRNGWGKGVEIKTGPVERKGRV